MESEQFSLSWNNFHLNLSSGFHSLLASEDFVDVTLAAEGKYIKAHKTVLSVCSPYFKELFHVNPCKHPIVILQDVNYEALKNILQFVYKGEVSVNQDEISAIMKLAQLLQIKGLTDDSEVNSNGTEDDDSSNQDNISESNEAPSMMTSFSKRSKRSAPPPIQKRPRTSYTANHKPTSAASSKPVKSTKTAAAAPAKRRRPPPPPLSAIPVISRQVENVTVNNVSVKQEPQEPEEELNYDDHSTNERLAECLDATESWSPVSAHPKRPSGSSPTASTVPFMLPIENVTFDSSAMKQETKYADAAHSNYDGSTYSEDMDCSSMLHTKLGEGLLDVPGSWSPDMKQNDFSSPVAPAILPGTISFISHFPKSLPPVSGRRKGQKECRMCKRRGVRKASSIGCPDCPGKPALCLDECFQAFHKKD